MRLTEARRQRVLKSGWRVVDGGRAAEESEDSEPPSSGPGGKVLH
jgi:hypothetical protein